MTPSKIIGAPAQGPGRSSSRSWLLLVVILASGLALLPLLTLLKDVLINRGESRMELGFDGLRQVRGTLLLVAG